MASHELDWEKLWNKPERAERTIAAPSNGAGHHDREALESYLRTALEDETADVARTAVGGRNDRLNVAAYNLGQLVHAGLGESVIRFELTAAAGACGLIDDDGLGSVNATITSGITDGQKRPRVIPERAATPDIRPFTLAAPVLVPPTEEELEAVSAAIRARMPLLDWHELWTMPDDDEWIVDPLIPARRLVALFSAPKVGKSLLMLEVAVAISRGSRVLGVPTEQARVLYVDFENDPRGDIRTRLQAMDVKPDDLADLCYLSYPRLAMLDTAAGGAELLAVCAEYECTVVIIDTISRAVGGEENDNDTWLAFYRNTGLTLKAAGITCVRLDHSGKDAEKGMRGGSAKYGDVDVVWKLAAVTDEMYRLDCEANRLPVHEKTVVIKRALLPTLRHEVQAEGRMAAFTAKVDEIIKALDSAGARKDIGRPGARELLKSTGVSVANATLEEAVRIRRLRFGDGP